MNIQTKAAAISTGLNIFLTLAKFAIYYFSGSLAILAEAWHSLSDIITSFLIFISVRHSSLKDKTAGPQKFELFTSFCIGLVLSSVAIGLIITFFQSEAQPIEHSLKAGILFIVLSFCSYFVYRFETYVGKESKSVGLISDGMHARADMTAALITGIALILYSIGLDIDRWVGGVIAFFILSFAMETFFNVGMAYYKKDADYQLTYKSAKIIGLAFERNTLGRLKNLIYSFLKNRMGDTRPMHIVYHFVLALPFLICLTAYLSTTLFVVDIRDQAFIERLGRVTNKIEPIGPGLHLKLPWPIDRIKRVKTTYIETINIGNTVTSGVPLIWTEQHGSEEPFLSGDDNFFYPYIVIHYKIKDVFQYLYKINNTTQVVRDMGHQVATLLFAQEEFYDIAVVKRKELEIKMHQTLQDKLDQMQCGINLITVIFKDIHPPISVAASFEAVIAGYQKKQTIINMSLEYQNQILPKSRGKALKEIEKANAYIFDRREKAEGDAARFQMSLPAKNEEKVTRMRLYLQTLQTVLKEKPKYLIDPKASEPEIWMDFESFNNNQWTEAQYQ